MIQHGWERVSTEGYRPLRWWLVLIEQTEKGPFVFARGGRGRNEHDCEWQIAKARGDARLEHSEFMRFRPTHALGAKGELIPVDHEPRPELAELASELSRGRE